MNLFLCYDKCSTCKKARTWLEQQGAACGQLYRQLGLKDKLPQLSDEEFFALLATDGMLVKRPILITEKGICPGFKPEIWQTLLD